MKKKDKIKRSAITWWNVLDDDLDLDVMNDVQAERYRQTKRYLVAKHSEFISSTDYNEITIEDVVILYNKIFNNG